MIILSPSLDAGLTQTRLLDNHSHRSPLEAPFCGDVRKVLYYDYAH